MNEILAVFIGSFIGSFIISQYFDYKRKLKKEYCEEKIKALEERITLLEKRALYYGNWPEFLEVEQNDK